MRCGGQDRGTRRPASRASAVAVGLGLLGAAAAPCPADAAAYLRTTVDDFAGLSLARCFKRSAAVYRAEGYDIAFAGSFGAYAQTDAGGGGLESSIVCTRTTGGRTVISISVAGPSHARTNAAALGLAEALVPGSTRAEAAAPGAASRRPRPRPGP